jgi:hypothetical protein
MEQKGPQSSSPGAAVQIDPINPTLKAPGTKRSKLKYHKLPSSFAFNFNLRRYAQGVSVRGRDRGGRIRHERRHV